MQAQRECAMGRRMIRSLPFATLLAASASAAFAQGPIDTVERGLYVCELPGDDAHLAGIPQPDRDFTIQTSSRYSSPQGNGTYLRRGKQVEMTSGPRRGEAYLVIHPGFLRERQADGTAGRLRCVRRG